MVKTLFVDLQKTPFLLGGGTIFPIFLTKKFTQNFSPKKLPLFLNFEKFCPSNASDFWNMHILHICPIHLKSRQEQYFTSPMLSTPKALALLSFPFSFLEQVSSGLFHHLLYNIWISPFSCKSNIAKEILSLHGEPLFFEKLKILNGSKIIEEKIYSLKIEVSMLTHRRCDAITFAIQKTTDLGKIAVSLDDIIEHRGFHEKSVIALKYPLYTFFVGRYEYRWVFTLHESPHFLINRYFRIL